MVMKKTPSEITEISVVIKRSHLINHVCYGRPAVGGAVRQQVSVEVSFASVAFRAVHARVRTNAVVGQHVLLQVKLPPETFSTFWTRVWFFSWRHKKDLKKNGLKTGINALEL